MRISDAPPQNVRFLVVKEVHLQHAPSGGEGDQRWRDCDKGPTNQRWRPFDLRQRQANNRQRRSDLQFGQEYCFVGGFDADSVPSFRQRARG